MITKEQITTIKISVCQFLDKLNEHDCCSLTEDTIPSIGSVEYGYKTCSPEPQLLTLLAIHGSNAGDGVAAAEKLPNNTETCNACKTEYNPDINGGIVNAHPFCQKCIVSMAEETTNDLIQKDEILLLARKCLKTFEKLAILLENEKLAAGAVMGAATATSWKQQTKQAIEAIDAVVEDSNEEGVHAIAYIVDDCGIEEADCNECSYACKRKDGEGRKTANSLTI